MAEYGLYGAMVRHSLPLPETILRSAKTGVSTDESCAPWLLGMDLREKLPPSTTKNVQKNLPGMHKKSIEAAATLKDGDDDDEIDDDQDDLDVDHDQHSQMGGDDRVLNKDGHKATSIAALRAKAQEHCDKINQEIQHKLNGKSSTTPTANGTAPSFVHDLQTRNVMDCIFDFGGMQTTNGIVL